nr:transcriptional regulator NrdR [bacterium]
MKCMYCGHTESRVIDSRPTEDGSAIRRRRECENCQRRFTTYEKVEMVPVYVIKRDGRRQLFDSQRIRSSILKACEKRSVPVAAVDALVSSIEKQVYNLLEEEIPTQRIGEMVMAGLKELDEVAYVRFASVYRQFKDIETFRQELDRLLGEK